MGLLNIPRELLLLIIHLVDIGSVFSLGHTCKFLSKIHTKHIDFVNLCEPPQSDQYDSDRSIIDVMIENDHVNLVAWMEPYCRLFTLNIVRKYCKKAAESGSFESLKYIHTYYSLNISSCEYIMDDAVDGGNLNLIKYLHDNGCDWDEKTCTYAAFNNNLDILKYLHENECPWNEKACLAACHNDHVDILKYLHENGCPRDSHACHIACHNGHLEIFKYLHENGCSLDEVVRHIVEYDHPDIVEYIRKTKMSQNSES